jgi:hypothetical protein
LALFCLVILIAVVCGILAIVVYQVPPVYERISWRFESLRTQIRYRLNPPEQAVFVPQEQNKLEKAEHIQTPIATFTPENIPIQPSSNTPTVPVLTETPTREPSATPNPTAIPDKVLLNGTTHEYQQMNNCGPATLSMALSYWGWKGDQRDTRAILRPNFAVYDDKNVSPFEMASFVETHTEWRAVVRVGGDIQVLKRLIAAGFPVIIEKGFQPPKEDWMGHYALITGYDDDRSRFITQDAYIMPDLPVPYEDLSERWWRDFNRIYLVIFPPARHAELLSILGSHTDLVSSFEVGAQIARQEIEILSGRDLFFAWYNLGTNLLGIQDYPGAARAFDQAFEIYGRLPEEQRPWRMLWYQVGPYEAYYHTGRYQDVIDLSHQTLSFLGAPILEESLYWRGLSKEALGDIEGALADLRKAAEINPTSTDVLTQLQRLGVESP